MGHDDGVATTVNVGPLISTSVTFCGKPFGLTILTPSKPNLPEITEPY